MPLNDDHHYPSRQRHEAYDATLEYLRKNIGNFFPNTIVKGQFDWDALFTPLNRSGVNRLSSQYWRINCEKSDRYTLSVKGSSAYRLKADESGYSNLFFAGDWTDNGVNAGCVEASVISGIQAAEAMSGKKLIIL